MRTAAPCSITARRRGSALSTRPAANSTASSVNPSAEPSSYPQIPRTRHVLASCGNFHWLLCEIGRHSVPALVSRIFTESIRCRQTAVLRCLGFLARSEGFARCIARAKNSEWVVYAKRPFAGPEQVLDYVGRYTHRMALSNNRLLDIENGQVRFQWKNYRDSGQTQTMTLSADEFIRRFLLHVLPNGFQRIRYYGFLGNRYRQQKLAQCRRLLGMPMPN